MATSTTKKLEDMTVEEQIAHLKSQQASIDEMVKSLNLPQYGGRLTDSTFSYFEGEESVSAKFNSETGPQALPKSYKQIPKGYRRGVFKSFGEFISDGYRAHKSGNVSEFSERFKSVFKGVQGMSVQDGSSAGFFVLPEFNMNVLERVYANDIWSRTDQYIVNNNMIFLANAETSRANGSRHGGLRGYWVDEGSSHTKSKPTMRRIELSLKKASVLVYLTDELISDGGPALEQYVGRKVAEEFNFMMGDTVFNGSGVQQPLGIFNSGAYLSITKEVGQTAATIVTPNIDKMWARRYTSGNYAWYHNQDCGPQLDNLNQPVGTGGVVLYRNPDGLASSAPLTLKNAPRIETEFNSTLGTAGDIVLADLGQYLTISKGGISQAYDTSIEFLTDQVALKFTIRVNGRPWETQPKSPYKGSSSQASFIGVETRA